ncbi:MAG: amidohydrolase family protein [Steroidobacteraceae bacterium]
MSEGIPRLLTALMALAVSGSVAAGDGIPAIDVHVHTWFPAMAAAYRDPRYTNEFVLSKYLALMDARRIERAVVSGADLQQVEEWQARAPGRFVPALMVDGPLDEKRRNEIRAWVRAGRLAVIGEVGLQYAGMAPDDPVIDEYCRLAVELDVPIAIHVGPITPAKPLLGLKTALVRNGEPLRLESLLNRYPELRLQVMHAGWPFTDQMIAVMTAYPNVYVDVANNAYVFGAADFHYHLKRLVDAGLSTRIMWGSDTSGPFEIDRAVNESLDNILNAPFLTDTQKRDILHDNAVRFFRLHPREH